MFGFGVGWLALAAYVEGWVPLQEPNVTRKGKRAGRGDLSVIKGFRKRARFYDFEAKYANLNLATANFESFSKVDDIEGKLSRAMKQTESKKPDYQGDVQVGLVFILLYTRKGTTKANQIDLLNKFKKTCTTNKALLKAKADFIGLYLAKYSFVNKVFKANNGEYEPCVGVAVLGKVA